LYFLGLAADYDGTIAKDGRVDAPTLDALARVKASGRKLILVTGRRLSDLISVFPGYELFDRIVAENGAVLFDPLDDQSIVFGPAVEPGVIEYLKARATRPIAVGERIIAGWEPDQSIFLQAIEDRGVEAQIIFNKGALMLLPTGINKASGLRAAARELDVAACALIGVGDGENDHSFLSICGCSCAVANAVDALKREVDMVTAADHGAGVRWLADKLIELDAKLLTHDRHGLAIGTDAHGDLVRLRPQDGNVLVVGPPMSGKSSLCAVICEAAAHSLYGFSVIDPEGDYLHLHAAAALDCAKHSLNATHLQTLLDAKANPVFVLRDVATSKRTELFRAAIRTAVSTNVRSGHPALLVIDEAHEGLSTALGLDLRSGPLTVLVTLAPGLLSHEALRSVDCVISFGENADALINEFFRLTGMPLSVSSELAPKHHSAIIWRRYADASMLHPSSARRRHVRHAGKYASGDVGHARSFFFRDRDGRLLGTARNLRDFVKVSRGLQPEVWAGHLARGDFTRWFRDVIRDESLAAAVEALQQQADLDPVQGIETLAHMIVRRYLCDPSAPQSTALDEDQ
jgi:hydroxymethylpyrimidine pyrophosphatase-like HAD family hydrolase